MEDFLSSVEEIKNGKTYPVYFCLGTNGYFIEKFLERVESDVLKGQNTDFNLDVLDYKEKSLDEVLDSANQLPVFSPKRVVITENFSFPKDKKEASKLMEYVNNPSETTVLLLICGDSKPGSELAKAKGKARILKFLELTERQLPQWIRKLASSYGKTLEPKAYKYFADFVGTDLKRIDSELSKISAYAGERTVLKAEDVDALVADTKIESIFSFIDSIGEGDLGMTLKMLEKIMNSKEMPGRILTMLSRHYRIVWKLKKGLAKDFKGDKLSQLSGVNPYFLPKYLGQAKRLKLGSLKKIIGYLAKADVELKSLKVSKKVLLEKLCIDLASLSVTI